MKNQITLSTLVVFILLMTQDCQKSNNIQEQVPPKGMVLKSVSVTNIPAKNKYGLPWDNDGTGPDIKFILGDHHGNIIYESEVISDTKVQQSYSFDIVPNIELDSLLIGEWTLYNEYEILPDIIASAFVDASTHQWLISKDSLLLKGDGPKVALFVEYVF